MPWMVSIEKRITLAIRFSLWKNWNFSTFTCFNNLLRWIPIVCELIFFQFFVIWQIFGELLRKLGKYQFLCLPNSVQCFKKLIDRDEFWTHARRTYWLTLHCIHLAASLYDQSAIIGKLNRTNKKFKQIKPLLDQKRTGCLCILSVMTKLAH